MPIDRPAPPRRSATPGPTTARRSSSSTPGSPSRPRARRSTRAVLARGVAAALADPDRLRYWVAEDRERAAVVGQAAITREWSDWRNGWIWWFQSVYVHPDHRGRGVFRALHAHIRDAARADARRHRPAALRRGRQRTGPSRPIRPSA